MQNFVYLDKLHEPLVKHEKNLGCSACLFAELSIVVTGRIIILAKFDSQILPDRTDICFTYNYWPYELNQGIRRTQLTVYDSVT